MNTPYHTTYLIHQMRSHCRLYYLILLIIMMISSLASCHRNKVVKSKKQDSETTIDGLIGYTLQVSAHDLAEDNTLSTQNDELLLIAYEACDMTVDEPIAMTQWTLTKDSPRGSVEIKSVGNVSCPLLVFLIEVDTDRSPMMIEAVCRVHSKKLLQAFETKDRAEIRRYLGDDDLIGAVKWEVSSLSEPITFTGIHLFDRYEYDLEALPAER